MVLVLVDAIRQYSESDNHRAIFVMLSCYLFGVDEG